MTVNICTNQWKLRNWRKGMRRIKIISNPYKKEIKYQDWNEHTAVWDDIIAETHPHSKLVSKEFKEGFFPFKVKKIIDQIIKEYFSEKIEIIFEGTRDEFNELKASCDYEDYKEKILVTASELTLENARDILPQIRTIFKDRIQPLVDSSVSDKQMVQEDLEKFSDASNEIIPVCVLGNYSAGKSTFINALIGREVLPSAERPTTAKIFKIAQEIEDEKASVKFDFGDEKVIVKLEMDSYVIDSTVKNELIDEITEALNELRSDSLYKRLKEVLEIVNEYEREAEDSCVSDLIEITVPFHKGIWTHTENKFVIFDTPGSNSASNLNHFEVLKKAMAGLTNGIPIFVTKYDQLDTTDNEKLYEEISSMKELDNRFTMIVVNKADTSSLPREGFTDRDRREILKQAVPKKMFSSGLYFVSSIMGLGFKNDGDFIDDHSAEIYEDNKEKYSNKESRFYKTLYKYNIMPEQLKKNAVEQALKSDELILVNSGLFSIEWEIQMFANKHAAYNKCEQSKLFLGKVIEITSDDIVKVKEQYEESKRILMESLEAEKKALLERLDNKGNEQEESYVAIYPTELKTIADQAVFAYSDEALKARDQELTRQYQDKFNYAKEGQDVIDAAGAFVSGLKDNVNDFVNKMSWDSLKKIGKGVVDSVKEVADEAEEWNKARLDAENEAGEFLLREMEADFDTRFIESKETIESASVKFWEEATETIRHELGDLIAGSKELSEEKKKELSEIIIQYQNITFVKHSEDMFAKEHFAKRFTLLGETGKLNLLKLRWTYNFSMKEDVNNIYVEIRNSHEGEFRNWLHALLGIIRDNIVDYSPVLHEQSLQIQEKENKILDLQSRYNMLQNYSNTIKSMMDWQTQ